MRIISVQWWILLNPCIFHRNKASPFAWYSYYTLCFIQSTFFSLNIYLPNFYISTGNSLEKSEYCYSHRDYSNILFSTSRHRNHKYPLPDTHSCPFNLNNRISYCRVICYWHILGSSCYACYLYFLFILYPAHVFNNISYFLRLVKII